MIEPPLCYGCIYIDAFDREKDPPAKRRTCSAFPRGIPDEILLGFPASGDGPTDQVERPVHSKHWEGQEPGFLYTPRLRTGK